MRFMAHFKYDREITLWLSSFMARALPGTPFPEEVAYDIHERETCDAFEYVLSMSLPLPDGRADIDVTMEIWTGPRLLGGPEPEPCFFDVRATRDMLDERGLHAETLYWDDGKGVWLAVVPDTDGDEDV